MTLAKQSMNTVKDKIATYHWCFQPSLISIKKWFKKLFNNFIWVIINHEFYVIIIRSISYFSIMSLEERKLIAIVNWIFHITDLLRLFIMSFKHGLIFLRYSLVERVLFLSPLIADPKITCSYSFAIIFSFFMLKKLPNIFSTLYLIALISFFSLKWCFIS